MQFNKVNDLFMVFITKTDNKILEFWICKFCIAGISPYTCRDFSLPLAGKFFFENSRFLQVQGLQAYFSIFGTF